MVCQAKGWVTTARKSVSSARPLRMDVAHRVLHPGIGDQDPERRTGWRRRPPARWQTAVELWGKAASSRRSRPPIKVDSRKKASGGLDGQQRAEDVPHISRVAGPVGAELEFQGDAGDHPDGKVDEEDFSPEFGHPPVVLVAGPDIYGFHDGDEDGKPQGQRDKEKMEKGGGGELQA